MKTITKTILRDNRHAWLSVKRKELVDLGILDDITAYSYQKKKSVYLEEDCDLTTYIDAQKKRNVTVKFKLGKCYQQSPVRSYDNFDGSLLGE